MNSMNGGKTRERTSRDTGVIEHKQIMKIDTIAYWRLIFASLLCVIALQACASIHSIQADDLDSYDQTDLQVFVNNGTIVRFMKSDYTIDSSHSARALKGEGLVMKDSSRAGHERFSGFILFSHIDSIQVTESCSESSAFGLGIVIVGLAIVLLSIAGWIFGPISIG